MPFLSTGILLVVSSAVALLAIGFSAFPNYLNAQFPAWRSYETTYCYDSVTTLSDKTPKAKCFTVASNGTFTRVFQEDATSASATVKSRKGHVLPGLWDGHGHLLQYGEFLHSVDLFGVKSIGEVRSRLIEYVTRNPEAGTGDQWLRGVGWDQAAFAGKWPTSADLEANEQLKHLYVMLDRVDVHCIWVSQKVLDLLPSSIPDVPGGEMPAQGVFCDNAMDLVMDHYSKPNKARKSQFIKTAMKDLNKLGIVGMHDAGVFPEEMQLYEGMAGRDGWTVRVYAMRECEKRNTFCPADASKIMRDDGFLTVRSVKLFADGALGSWGSAMIEPYSDHPWSSGSLLVNATSLTQLAITWASEGFQVNIHAIGDLANRLAIDAMSAALDSVCPISNRHACQAGRRSRIEHAQIIHPDDQKRMHEIGIIPSIQPTHATSDMPYAETRLGEKRTDEEAYRMRSLLPLNPVLGSDFPVEPANIFQGIFAAITRRSPHTGLDAGGGADGWHMDEALTREQALRAFTVGPAHGAFLEGRAGVIDVGAFADWIVLQTPFEEVEVDDIRHVEVLETWVAGKRVYQRSSDKA